ncbi:MAG: ATP-binding protein [Candidatus Lokiarchaeota archaeon]|nr:ATP-binding protein [Candidatus Lokiarchaeota archaeon]
MAIKVGTVFNYLQLPNVSKFAFVINKRQDGTFIQKGLFVYTKSSEGFLIGIIEEIVLLNEYFTDALTIKAFNNNDNPNILKGLFPSDDFEFAIAIVKCLGLIKFRDKDMKEIERVLRMSYPASPGKSVYIVEEEILNKFLGFDIKSGINLGQVKVTNSEALINMNRLLNKHFAILSISGGGKSYLTSVLIEELLTRNKDFGTPSIILFDVHGEYLYLKDIPEFKDKVKIQDISYFQIGIPKLSAYSFKKYQEQISTVQLRELSKFIKKLRKEKEKKNQYTLNDIIKEIENESEGNKSTKQALIGWLSELERLTLFGSQENPSLDKVVNNQEITIFNFQKEISIRKKQIIVDYICNRLFDLRRKNNIPPFLLIVEEAHQFCPEAAHSKALSKPIIEMLAREGRKFMACLCLISQRPKKLSTTALSQCNSKLVLNIKNPYDLKHLMDSSEAITKEYTSIISSLGVGEMLLMGNAVNYPVFIDVRKRRYKSKSEEISLAQFCLNWQKKELI